MAKFIEFTNGALSARYDSAIHGERRINIIDPEWKRPTRDVTVQPGQAFEYGDERGVLNNTGVPQVVKDVPDLSAVPDYILVDNPNCKIPAEAIEVSDELFWQTINETDGVWSMVDGDIIKLPFPAPTAGQLQYQTNADARAYLNSTGWIIEKLSEYKLLNLPVDDLLIKYADQLTKRAEARAAIIEVAP